jgi:hypothetical protein
MRFARLALVLLATLAACTASVAPSETPGVTKSLTPSAGLMSPSPSPAAVSTPVKLPRLVLYADLATRPEGWKQVLFVPFVRVRSYGPDASGLGFIPPDCCGGAAPMSFAIADGSKGSFWIADTVNQRVVRVLASGRIVETISGTSDVESSYGFGSADIVPAPGGLYGILDSTRGVVGWATRDGLESAVHLTDGRHDLMADWLFRTADTLHVNTYGPVEDRWGYDGYGTVDLRSGVVSPEPGAPVGDGWIDIEHLPQADLMDVHEYQVSWYRPAGLEATRRIRFRLVGDDGRRVPSWAWVSVESAAPGGVVADVAVRGEDVGWGVDWCLLVPSDPSVAPVFVRLPESDFDSGVVGQRHLLLAKDGHVYLMITDDDGVRILRR